MNGAPVYWNSPTYGPAIYVWPAGDPLKVFRLVGGLFTTPASAQSTALAAGGMPGGMLSLSANGSNGWHRHSLGDAVARRRRQSHAAARNPARLRRRQRDARALEQPAERRARHARQLLEVQPADGGRRQGVRRDAVEQAGGLRIDWRRPAATPRRSVNAGADQTSSVAGDRRRSPARRPTTAIPIPPGQLTTTWSLVSGPGAVTFSTPNALSTTATFSVPGTYTIRLSAFDGQATSSDDMTVVVDVAGRLGHRPARAVLQRRRQRRSTSPRSR